MSSHKNPVILLILAYIPGLLLPLIMEYSSVSGNPVIAWLYMLFWVIFVFILLITAYLISRERRA
ncbi:hypothetical protein [Staphylothermus marinus]|nr:hypothetical protein [Staphylothermus marinus]